MEVVTCRVLDRRGDALGLEGLNQSDFEESPHHDCTSVVPSLREAAVHLSPDGDEVAASGLAQDAQGEQTVVFPRSRVSRSPGRPKREEQVTRGICSVCCRCRRGENALYHLAQR